MNIVVYYTVETLVRYLFVTQSGNCRPLYDMYLYMKSQNMLDKAGFVITDKREFISFKKDRPDFELDPDIIILKEWELTTQRHYPVNIKKLREIERNAFPSSLLYNAIQCDRRLIMGRRAPLRQDYRRRLPDSALMAILSAGVDAVTEIFDKLQPHVVINLTCVTWLDYLIPQIGRNRGAITLNIRPTKIDNYIGADPYLRNPSPALCQRWEKLRSQDEAPSKFATAYIEKVKEGTKQIPRCR